MSKQILQAPLKKASAADSLTTISNVLLSAFVISGLYFGREILIPLALATLLTFMVAPLVTRVQRWIGRVSAVLLVTVLMVASTTIIHAHYLSSKIRTQFPEIKIVVGIWAGGERSVGSIQPLKTSGANDVVMSLTSASDQIELLAPLKMGDNASAPPTDPP